MRNYIGGGVYAEYDEHGVILTTINNYPVTGLIYLDNLAVENLIKLINSAKETQEKANARSNI